ncbi:MAG: hypothetical protein F6K17_13385 [Okeania sp. SIO3C4]|nr:hypothetical protein [Okeania sp. SIO3B3]NER03533.1 hypothetical protein [Okeania sp. SIO3C4]
MTTTLVIAAIISWEILPDIFKQKPVDAAERIVGALGNSFGITTVFSLGGANINLPRLNQEFDPEKLSLNISTGVLKNGCIS